MVGRGALLLLFALTRQTDGLSGGSPPPIEPLRPQATVDAAKTLTAPTDARTYDDAVRACFDAAEIDEAAWERLEAHASLVAAWNERLNLISRNDVANLATRHVLPALALLKV